MDKIYVTKSSMPDYDEYIKAIKPLWDTHIITNMGQYHRRLEEELTDYLKVPKVSLMVNGHMALELAIQSFDFARGSEVITTPFTFISSTHAIVRNGLNPVFCDVKQKDGTIDESKIEKLITEKTVAILAVHVYGNVCNVDAIQRIADKYNLKVIYDAAHAFGVKYQGKGIGYYGDVSIFSFHATKVFNTIEGGAVTFSDSKLYDKLYNLKNFGIRGEENVVEVGANAKMNEFSAIMGLCNLKKIDDCISDRKQVNDLYEEELKNVKGITMLQSGSYVERNYSYFPILVDNEYPISRDELYQIYRNNEIFVRKYFYPLTSDQACFKNKYRDIDLPIARDLSNKILVLPIYESLSREDVKRIVIIIKNQK